MFFAFLALGSACSQPSATAEFGDGTGGLTDSDTDATGGSEQPPTGLGSAGSGDSGGSGPGTSGEPSTSGAGEDSGDLPAPGYAEGITITRVTFNQGIEVGLYDQATGVNPAARLIAGRRGVISLGWSLAAGFEPRPLRAVLALQPPGGEVQVVERTFMVAGNASPDLRAMEESLPIPAELAVEGVAAAVAFFEVEPGTGSVEPPPGSRLPGPADAFAPLPIDSRAARFEIRLVPIRHEFNGCVSSPPQGPEVAGLIADHVAGLFPLQGADVTMSPEVTFAGAADPALDNVLAFMVDVRASLQLAPNVFVYGLIDPCGERRCAGGIAYIPIDPVAADEGPWRVGVGRTCTFSTEEALATMAHELGHNLGREHVACNGDEPGPDPAYPHAGGQIGAWGFDAGDDRLLPPSVAEFMSYCDEPTWISDYGWTRAYDVATALSGMSASTAPPLTDRVRSGPSASTLLVRFDAGGEATTRWLTGVPLSGGQPTQVQYVDAGGRTAVVEAVRVKVSHSAEPTLLVAAPPAGFGDPVELRWRGDASPRVIALPSR